MCMCVVYMYMYIFVRQKEYNSLQIEKETHNYLSLCGPSNGNDSSRHYYASPETLRSALIRPKGTHPKGNKYNKTNVSQQIQTQRQRLEPRRAYQKHPKLFALRLFAVFSLLCLV